MSLRETIRRFLHGDVEAEKILKNHQDAFLKNNAPLVFLFDGQTLVRILDMWKEYVKKHEERPTVFVIPRGKILGMEIELGDKLEVKGEKSYDNKS